MEAVLDCLCIFVQSAGWGGGAHVRIERRIYADKEPREKKIATCWFGSQVMRAPLRSLKVKETPLKLADETSPA